MLAKQISEPQLRLTANLAGVLLQHRQILMSNQQPDGAALSWDPLNEAFCFEHQHHLVHRGRRDPEVLLHIGLRRRTSIYLRVVVDERQVLPCFLVKRVLITGLHWRKDKAAAVGESFFNGLPRETKVLRSSSLIAAILLGLKVPFAHAMAVQTAGTGAPEPCSPI